MDMASSHAMRTGMAAPATSGGIGFGLGGWVAVDACAAGGLVGPSPGSYSWGGAAATSCFIDRTADLGYLFYTQQLMNAQRELSNFGRADLSTLIYAALIDPAPNKSALTSTSRGATGGAPVVASRL